jgi:hypothetical protein
MTAPTGLPPQPSRKFTQEYNLINRGDAAKVKRLAKNRIEDQSYRLTNADSLDLASSAKLNEPAIQKKLFEDSPKGRFEKEYQQDLAADIKQRVVNNKIYGLTPPQKKQEFYTNWASFANVYNQEHSILEKQIQKKLVKEHKDELDDLSESIKWPLENHMSSFFAQVRKNREEQFATALSKKVDELKEYQSLKLKPYPKFDLNRYESHRQLSPAQKYYKHQATQKLLQAIPDIDKGVISDQAEKLVKTVFGDPKNLTLNEKENQLLKSEREKFITAYINEHYPAPADPASVPLPDSTDEEIKALSAKSEQPKWDAVPLPDTITAGKQKAASINPASIPLPDSTEEEIRALAADSDNSPSNPQTSNTTNEAGTVETPAAVTPAKPATEAAKAETTKTENKENEKKEDEGGGILQGWKKTKMSLGAALLAGGIALKMTLIGIVPGLIMAGVGATLMGWAGINWAMGGKKDADKTDENKDKKADAPATENK